MRNNDKKPNKVRGFKKLSQGYNLPHHLYKDNEHNISMGNNIKKYHHGELMFIKTKLNSKEKKIIDDYVTYLKGGMCDFKSQIVERQLLMIRDSSKVPYDQWNLTKLREFLSLLNQSSILSNSTKNDIKKHFKRFLKERYKDWNHRFNELKDIRCGNDINHERINSNTLITKEELEKILRGAESLKLKSLIITLYETGGRPKEICTTKWKDVNLERGEIQLISTKNNTSRVVPIKESIIHLKRYYNEYPFPDVTPNDYIFPTKTDRKLPLGRSVLWSLFGQLTNRTIGRRLFPYILRHTRATELQKKLTSKVYERVMDHSIEMASRYSHLNKDDIRDEMLEKVYHIEELTPKEKEEIIELRKELLQSNKNFNQILMIIIKVIESKTPKERKESLNELKLIRKQIEQLKTN